jgi:hypothetical protein
MRDSDRAPEAPVWQIHLLTYRVARDLDRAICFGNQSSRDATEPEPFESAAKPAPADKNCISIPLLFRVRPFKFFRLHFQ